MDKSQINQVIAELRAESKVKKLVTGQSVEALELWADRLERALASSPSQPAGWVLVPVEPTLEMIHAGREARHKGGATRDVYSALIAAAPALVEGKK